jgi:hypothetical protein
MTSTTRSHLQRTALTVLALLAGLVAVVTLQPAATAATAATSTVVVAGCATGTKTLGAYYADAAVRVYACGARPSFDGARTGGGTVVRPYAGSDIYYRGYQCVELVARFLAVRFHVAAVVANGAQAVDRYAAAYPSRFVRIANGAKGKAPRIGDVLSLSTSASFNDVGHTGVVIGSSVNAAGNGTIGSLEQNWGGAGGTTGHHTYTVRSWRVGFTQMPYVKWLRTR